MMWYLPAAWPHTQGGFMHSFDPCCGQIIFALLFGFLFSLCFKKATGDPFVDNICFSCTVETVQLLKLERD